MQGGAPCELPGAWLLSQQTTLTPEPLTVTHMHFAMSFSDVECTSTPPPGQLRS